MENNIRDSKGRFKVGCKINAGREVSKESKEKNRIWHIGRIMSKNRPYWTKLFQDKLKKLYNYKYDENGNIILEVQNVSRT